MQGFFIIEITINFIQINLKFGAEFLPVFKQNQKEYPPVRSERRIMTYCQFVQEVEEKIKEEVRGSLTVSVYTTVKNNGVKRIGLMFSKQGINIAPAIYLETFYEEYKRGQSVCGVAEDILALYGKVEMERSWEEESFLCYEKVRDRIVFRLINQWANAEFLQTVPFVPYLDLAVVFYVLIEANDHGTVSLLVKESLKTVWKVSTGNLYEQALCNTPRLLPYEFESMQALLEKSGLSPCLSEEEFLYVLGNRFRSFGAASILYPNRLKNIGRILEDDYYVLPSSVHEVLIVPAECVHSRRALDDMVKEVNETCVEEEEVLSGHVYYYDREEDLLTM